MRELKTELWDHFMSPGEIICITTNGFVKMNGMAVCGRGCALEATKNIPEFSKRLGRRIRCNGNTPGLMDTSLGEYVFIFPVKHNWWEKASIDLIVEGALALEGHALDHPFIRYYLPRPGCGNGQLDWGVVKPIIEFLPDNVIAVTK